MRFVLARSALAAVAVALGGCGGPPPAPPPADAPANQTAPAGPTNPGGVAPKPLDLGFVTIQPGVPAAAPAVDPDALPAGAVFRLGSEHGKPPKGWQGVLLPTGTHFLALHSLQQPHSYLHYTLYDVNGLKPVGPAVLSGADSGDEVGAPHSVSLDGKRLATTSARLVNVYDLASGKRILKLPRPGSGEYPVASLSADGKRLAVGGAPQGGSTMAGPTSPGVACTVWDVDAGTEVARVTVLQNAGARVALSPDGKTLVTTGSHRDFAKFNDPDYPEKVTQIWDVDSKTQLARVTWPKDRSLTFSPDSKTVALRTFSPPQVVLAEPRTGKTLHTLDLKETGTGPVAFTPDSKQVAVVAASRALRWDVATGAATGGKTRPADLPARVFVSGAAFDASGRLVAFGGEGLCAYTWDAGTGTLLSPGAAGHSRPVRTVAFTPDGAEVRTGGADGTVLRWAASNGKLLGQTDLRGPGETEADVYVTADGRHAIVRGVLHAVDGRTKPTNLGAGLKPGEYVSAVYPSADGTTVAVVAKGGSNKPVRCVVLNAASGAAMGEAQLPGDLIRAAAAVGAGGTRLVTAHSTKLVNNSTDVVVASWELPAGRKVAEYTLPNGGGVCGLALLDGRRAVVATGMGHVKVVDVESGALLRDVTDPARLACNALSVSRDGKLIAVGHTGRSPAANYNVGVRVYDAGTGEVRHTLAVRGPVGLLDDSIAYYNATFPPEAMAFSPDGSRLAVPALTTAVVWDLAKVGPAVPK